MQGSQGSVPHEGRNDFNENINKDQDEHRSQKSQQKRDDQRTQAFAEKMTRDAQQAEFTKVSSIYLDPSKPSSSNVAPENMINRITELEHGIPKGDIMIMVKTFGTQHQQSIAQSGHDSAAASSSGNQPPTQPTIKQPGQVSAASSQSINHRGEQREVHDTARTVQQMRDPARTSKPASEDNVSIHVTPDKHELKQQALLQSAEIELL